MTIRKEATLKKKFATFRLDGGSAERGETEEGREGRRRCSFALFTLISLPFRIDSVKEEGSGERTGETKRRRIDARSLVSTHHNISISPSHRLFFVLGR